MNSLLRGALFTFVFVSTTFAGAKDLSEYPLRVEVVETQWNRNPYGGTTGSGYGNLRDGDSFRGFDYTYSCDRPFNPSQGGTVYPAKWKTREARLVILTYEIGNTSKQHDCELKVTMANHVYALKDGHLVTYTLNQYQDLIAARKTLQQQLHPSDIDPSHYPLKVILLEMEWRENPTGGFLGTGRGNIRDGETTSAFDFSALCASRLTISAAGTSYSGRWETQPTQRLVLLAHGIGDTQTARTCDLKTDLRPTHVYLRNPAGVVNALTQEEFKKWLETRKAAQASQTPPSANSGTAPELSKNAPAGPSKLTNSDIISMVSSGLSVEVITAKMNAAETSFDTSAEGLRQLKAGRVPDALMIEMIKRTKP